MGALMARKPKLGLPLQTLRNAPDAQEGRLAREAEQTARLREGITEIPVSPDRHRRAA